MVYDEGLANRIRELISAPIEVDERKMFGGIGFLVNGNMACGVNREDLIIRVGSEYYQEALSKPHIKEFDLTGRAMTGWIVVKTPGYQLDIDLTEWLDRGFTFALTLPKK